jgi:hypothetical protein
VTSEELALEIEFLKIKMDAELSDLYRDYQRERSAVEARYLPTFKRLLEKLVELEKRESAQYWRALRDISEKAS